MSRSKKPRNAGPILIVGGVIIAVITIGGAYLSRHPDVIGKLFRSSGSGMDYAAMDQQITIPESCAAVPTHAFQLLCDEIGNIAPPAWDQALSAEEKACIGPVVDEYRSVTLALHNETEADYDDTDRNAYPFLFACEAIDINIKFQDKYETSPQDSKEFLTRFTKDWQEEVKTSQ